MQKILTRITLEYSFQKYGNTPKTVGIKSDYCGKYFNNLKNNDYVNEGCSFNPVECLVVEIYDSYDC
jgi:hypothetical protein